MGSYSGWWFQPTLKLKNISQIGKSSPNICQIGSFPQVGLKIEHIWNHHIVKGYLPTPCTTPPKKRGWLMTVVYIYIYNPSVRPCFGGRVQWRGPVKFPSWDEKSFFKSLRRDEHVEPMVWWILQLLRPLILSGVRHSEGWAGICCHDLFGGGGGCVATTQVEESRRTLWREQIETGYLDDPRWSPDGT